MKKIITSIAMIAAIGALVIGATGAFFNDTETSVGNTFTAGTIDIMVGDENPWTTNWQNYLDKPSQTNYMNFTVKNVGENSANLWKRLTNVVNEGGDASYCGASSEPEYYEGGGTGNPTDGCDGTYIERNNLSAFMIYDMAICRVADGEEAVTVCPFINDEAGQLNKPDLSDNNWVVLVDANDQVRVDNVADTWVKLAENLGVDESLVVSQSYHLMTWDDSGQPVITNWAQGDIMTFDVELDARQLTAPAPGTTLVNDVVRASASLVQKDTTTWAPILDGANGTLTYDVEGDTFNYDLVASGLANDTYQLVYYSDPWANPKAVILIGSQIAVSDGSISANGNVDLATDLPDTSDANYPVGAKVWLVTSSSLSSDQLSWINTSNWLFDLSLVNYEDTNN